MHPVGHKKAESRGGLNSPLKNVASVAEARRKCPLRVKNEAKKRSLHAVNEHFEPNFDDAPASAVVFQRTVKPWPPARTCILQAASCILFLLLLAPALAGKEELAALPSPGTTPAQVRLLADDHYFPVLLDAINGARHRIDMVMFLLKTSDRKNNRPARLVAALIKARQRGVRVEVVLEHSGYNDSINGDNQQAAATLRANDIKVRFDSPRRTAHTKLVVIDSRFSFVGSHNLSQAALTYNHEMSLLLDNRQLAGELTDYIAAIPEHHESF